MRLTLTRYRWTWLAVAGIAGVLVAGLAPGAHGFIPLPCADADAPQCMGACVDGQACVSISRGGTATCVCRDVGCCRTGAATCIEDVTALACLGMGGSWGRFETCADGCTPTGNPNGGECTDASECQSDNCADGVCCDSPCDGPNQACNVTGQVGECANVPAPAPAASRGALALTAGTLIAIAALALLRRRWR